MTNDLSDQKFQNAVLYILHRAPTPPGITVLLKLLYFADYEHYREHLTPITGAPYVALKNGPVIDNYKQRFAALVQQGLLAETSVPSGREWPKTEYVAKREPDMSLFSATELEVLDAVIARYGTAWGSELSQRTHLEGPWAFAWDANDPGRPIPYILFRWLENLPDEADAEQARALIARPDVAAALAEAQARIAQ